MIIAISGKKNSGKDTVGRIIQYLQVMSIREKNGKFSGKYNEMFGLDEFLNDTKKCTVLSSFEIKKWADKLKNIICLLLNCTREQLEDREFKEKELGKEWWYWKNSFGKRINYLDNTTYGSKNSPSRELIKLTPRKLLQLLGTECGRNIIHPNIWCTSIFVDYYGDIEKWKDIIGYEGKYQISTFGRIKGLNRKTIYGDESKGEYHTKKEAILKPTVTGKYQMIKLEGNNSVTIHSLVANHFIPKVKEKSIINHIDQNPLNNFYKNLEWCTQSENLLSANKAGNGNIGSKQAHSKLTEQDVLEIKNSLKYKTHKQTELAELYGVSTTTISDIKLGKKWNHVGKSFISITPILPIPYPNWVITDTRFPNEVKAVKDKGGINIRVNRYKVGDIVYWDDPEGVTSAVYKIYEVNEEFCSLINESSDTQALYSEISIFEDPSHESEIALDTYIDWDYVIDNNGSIEELIEKVRRILIKEKII